MAHSAWKAPSNGTAGHIQIDDPTFCYFCHDNMIADMGKAGVDYHALLDTYIRAINVVTADRPNDLIISVHMCRGNFKVHLAPHLSGSGTHS